jgi:mannose-1-phosphate guanylyltransferase
MKEVEMDLVVMILAGGGGTRFWPLSTEEKPKQFLKLFGDRSLLQKSFDRVCDIIPPQRILVLTNMAFIDLVKEQLPEIPSENVIGEPMVRDTAAAICLGAMLSHKRFGNPVIATLTADHMIEPIDIFHKTLLSAARMARESETLYTFGIQPTYPATGYGYLELGTKVADDEGIEHFQLVSFKEKPDMETASHYVEEGRFYWNSGMFVWTTTAILREIETYIPHHLRAISEAVMFEHTPQWDSALKKVFESLETISIDYAVMEKAQGVRCVVSKFSWIDVGSWQALKDFLPHDDAENCCRGKAFTLDCKGNLVFCENPIETVMLIGVQDLVVVRAGQRTLVAHKDRSEEIKKLVKIMQNN